MTPSGPDITALGPPPPDIAQREPIIHDHRGPMARIRKSIHTTLRFGRAKYYRFDAPQSEFGTLYVADDLVGALLETRHQQDSNHRPVISHQWLGERSLVTVTFQRPLHLIDISDSPGLLAIGADNRLSTGPRRVAQLWARALWNHLAKPDGIWYLARNAPRNTVAVLFEDRCGPDVTLAAPISLAQHPELPSSLNRLRIGLVP